MSGQSGGAMGARLPLRLAVRGLFLLVLLSGAAGRARAGDPSPAPEAARGTLGSLPIEFEGFLPGSLNTSVNGSFDLTFRIYTSPADQKPAWEEKRKVEVVRGRLR